jgi:hypothetical protein
MNIPKTLRAGDTWSWTESLSAYPATAYTLKFSFWLYGHSAKTITAAADGAAHAVSQTPADTAAYASGDWRWTAYVEKGSGDTLERYTVGEGRVTIAPSLASAAPDTDLRSYWQKVLDAVHGAILEFAAKGHASITVDGKSATYKREQDLLALQRRAEQEVATEKLAERGEGAGRITRIEFGRG